MTFFRKIIHKVICLINRKRLKNNDFSIICNSCIGGVIYHKLGKQFLSPTINLWMTDHDFLKFIHKLDDYLASELHFVQGIESYPTAYCKDVLIHFNHYHSEEDARQKWNERKNRVNRDNLFIIMSDRPSGGEETEITYDDILSLKKINCAGKVVFSTKTYPDIDYIVHLPKDKEGDYVNLYMFDKTRLLKLWRWELLFDYVGWLNGTSNGSMKHMKK